MPQQKIFTDKISIYLQTKTDNTIRGKSSLIWGKPYNISSLNESLTILLITVVFQESINRVRKKSSRDVILKTQIIFVCVIFKERLFYQLKIDLQFVSYLFKIKGIFSDFSHKVYEFF